MKVILTVEVEYNLPEPLLETYGTEDITQCVEIDMETDAAPVLLDGASTLVKVERAS